LSLRNPQLGAFSRVDTLPSARAPLVYLEHMKISFIGLGNMGLPMARHLLQAGHKLTVYNRTPARADQLKQFKPVVGDSPAAAGRDAEVLVTMVADDAALEDVMLGPQGALAALPAGRSTFP